MDLENNMEKIAKERTKRTYSVTSNSEMSTGRSLNGAVALARKVVVVAIIQACT